MRLLVTGGAGFIGSNVVDRLLARGDSVVAFDNFDPYYDPAQKRRNVARALQNDRYSLVEGDIRSPEQVEDAFRRAKPDAVVHLAAKAGVRSSVQDPRSYVEVNELGGLLVLEAALRHGKVPVAYASTSSVYGAGAEPPFHESDPATGPLSPYAASKRSGELMAHALHHVHQLPIVILRFFTVYGPRGRPDMAFARFTEALRQRRPIRLHAEATERDFTYVEDIVDGVVASLSWVGHEHAFGTFNLGRSEPVRVRRLIELLARELDAEPNVVVGELELGESPRTAACVDKARAAFGYDPKVTLEEGVKRWVAWVNESDEAPSHLRAG